MRLIPGSCVGRAALSLFCLAPRGVCRAALVALGAVGSYPTISPLPFIARRATKGGLFSAALSVRIPSRKPVPRFREARCPMVSGLSSTPPPEEDETATVRGAAKPTLPYPRPTNNPNLRPPCPSPWRIFARAKSPENPGFVEWRFASAMNGSGGLKPPVRDMAPSGSHSTRAKSAMCPFLGAQTSPVRPGIADVPVRSFALHSAPHPPSPTEV